jgi:hypothetical protein
LLKKFIVKHIQVFFPGAFLAIVVIAVLSIEGCDPSSQDIAQEQKESSYYDHQLHDPYRVFRYGPTGAVMDQWVATGQPDSGEHAIYFTELGTGMRIMSPMPSGYQQAPGAKPQPHTPSKGDAAP